jgi:hypothetical protein
MRWVLVAAFALGGCPGPTDPEPDASVQGDVGIHLAWSTAHPNSVPGPSKAGVTITSARFSLADVRVIGDIAPNDPRTKLERLELAWSQGVSPAVHAFLDAPPGIYSRVGFELAVDGDVEVAYEITGTARIEALDVPFRIVDNRDMDVAVSHKSASLSPGNMIAIGIRLDFEKVIDRVDIANLPLIDGVRVLDQSDAQIEDVRKAIHDDLFRGDDDDIN